MSSYYDYHATHQLHRPLAFVGFVNALTRKVVHHLSSMSGLPEVHLDDLIQHELGASSHEILTRYGLKEWRATENRLLGKVISSSPPSILALGEGAIDQSDDLNVVLDWTQLIYLHLPVEEAVSQASRQNAVHGATLWAEVESRRGAWDDDIRSLYEERTFNYRMSHRVVDLSNRKINDLTSEILAMIPAIDAEPALV